ncbi:uncharacterized protein BYT42DRAFT_589481 [Radiomyces spectabilis]|uniref:uncharacterized protein n=1 Tax=Radiomyces spectabilis TaxID=64574 RepID=UPI0022208BEC|nr:uncharacterized protein BYT42DRAFT_589481 [Radiomyces spectabilis]KAI8365292.1 hypothetical protein BYT42DRAFT_589481 [Radiomyces spectabilis]
MTLLRTLRSKGWILAIVVFIFLYLFTSFRHTSPSPSKTHDTTSSEPPQVPPIDRRFRRINKSRQAQLTSALAHIRTGYVANRTPDYDTPPLLVLYRCTDDAAQCGSFQDRLLSIASAYFFAMFWDGAAFACHMRSPVRFDWYFESLPSYMSMNTDQANFYLERADPASILTVPTMQREAFAKDNFVDTYRSQNVRIVQSSHWEDWSNMQKNPSMQKQRDKYQLGRLATQSEWFWIVSQLLFSNPTSWLAKQLEPHRDLMGGYIHASESLSPYDPGKEVAPHIRHWLRVGVRATSGSDECMVSHAINVCDQAVAWNKECHIFLSAPSSDELKRLQSLVNRYEAKKTYRVIVHTVSQDYEFYDLHESLETRTSNALSFIESKEARVKQAYARTFMDWLILTRMDYLIGEEQDMYIKTAAWAAQVHTDLSSVTHDDCRISAMKDW